MSVVPAGAVRQQGYGGGRPPAQRRRPDGVPWPERQADPGGERGSSCGAASLGSPASSQSVGLRCTLVTKKQLLRVALAKQYFDPCFVSAVGQAPNKLTNVVEYKTLGFLPGYSRQFGEIEPISPDTFIVSAVVRSQLCIPELSGTSPFQGLVACKLSPSCFL